MPFQSFFEWYHPNIKLAAIAQVIIKSKENGSFLVYPHDYEDDMIKYQIAYKQDGQGKCLLVLADENKNFRIQHTGMKFKTLNNLVEYYWNKSNDENISMKFPLIHAVRNALFAYPSFYHGSLARNEAETLLRHKGVDSFLLRDSTTLSVQLVVTSYSQDRDDSPFLHSEIKIERMQRYFEAKDKYVLDENAILEYIMMRKIPGNRGVYSKLLPVRRTDDVKDRSLPPEILRMDKKSISLFKQALQEGKDKCYNIRLIIIGHFGAGKTTLTKRLMGEDFDIQAVTSTNGVDIFIINCSIEPDGSWAIEQETNVDDLHFKRMANTLIEFKISNTEMTESESTDNLQGSKSHNSEITGKHGTELVACVYSENEETGMPEKTFRLEPLTEPKGATGKSEFECPPIPEDEINSKEDEVMYADLSDMAEEIGIAEDLKKVVQVSEYLPTKRNMAKLRIWDFAGQAIFYNTHLAFLSRRAQYLLVTDVNRPLNDIVEDNDFSSIGGKQKMTVADFANFWVNVVHSISSSKRSPKIFLASTHRDQLKYISEINDTLISEHFQGIRQLFQNNPARFHLFEEDFCIDCTNPHDPGILYLRKKIFDVAVQEEHWGEEIPSSWMFMERQFRKQKLNGKRVITLEDVRSMNKALIVNIKSEEEIILFLHFQHAIGEVLYFDEKVLKDIVILDPQWLIDSFKCIITAKDFVAKLESQLSSLWDSLYDEAVLKPELIEAVWQKHADQQFINYKDYLLLLLTNTGIIAKPKAYYDDGKEKKENFYLVPCMLNEMPSKIVERLTDNSSVILKQLWFIFCHDFLPPAIFFRLLASCIGKFPVAKFNNSSLVYTKVAVFNLSSDHSFILEHCKNAITLQIIGTDEFVPTCLSHGLKRFIEETVKGISEIYSLQDQTSEPGNYSPFSLAVQCSDICKPFLNSKSEMVCENSNRPHNLELSDYKLGWIETEQSKAVDLPEFAGDVTGNILDTKPTYQELGRIARRIGTEIYELGIMLGLQKYQIDQLKMTFSNLAVDFNFQILKMWMAIEKIEKCNFSTLRKAMEEVSIDVSFFSRVPNISTEASKAFPKQFLEMIPSDEQIDHISLHVGAVYQQLAIELGLKPERLEHIEMDKHKTLDRVIHILKDWREEQSFNATFFHLCNAMYEVTMDMSILKKLSRKN